MRILYLADIRFPLERANGIQSIETCHALAARGHDVTMVVRPDTQSPRRDPFEFYGLPPIPSLHIETAVIKPPPTLPGITSSAYTRAAYLTFALGRAAGRARQDLVFTRDLGVASLLLRLPAWTRPSIVYEAHGIAADTAAALPDLLTGAPRASASKLQRLARRDERVWRGADGYVTITDGLARELSRRFGPRDAVAVVPDGTRLVTEPSGESAADRAAEPRPFTIGYAGHLYPWKGVDLVIEAIAALLDTEGLIIGGHQGEPDLARIKALVDRLHCSSRVTFAGHLPPHEARRRLRDAHVLTLPNPSSVISREFTSPLKLFEYMAAGRPIVASDLPSIREVLRDGDNAILVEAGNPQALTEGIRRIKDDPALGDRLALRALDDVGAYTWEARAGRLETLFRQVIG